MTTVTTYTDVNLMIALSMLQRKLSIFMIVIHLTVWTRYPTSMNVVFYLYARDPLSHELDPPSHEREFLFYPMKLHLFHTSSVTERSKSST